MIIIPDNFYNEIDKAFNAVDLGKIVKLFTLNFLAENIQLCQEEGVKEDLLNKVIFYQNPTKAYKVRLFCLPFATEKLFAAFRAYLPEDVRKVMDTMVWEVAMHENEIKEKLGVTVTEMGDNGWGNINYVLKKEYVFLKSIKEYDWSEEKRDFYTLHMLPAMRVHLMSYYPKPKNYELNPTDLQPTTFTYNGEQEIFFELPRLVAYHGQGNIKLTAKERPTVSSVNKMQRTLNLAEFFEGSKEKVMKNLRSNAIASMLILSDRLKGAKNDEKFLKRLFHLYRTYEHFSSFPMLHTIIKGTGHLDTYSDLRKIEPRIFDLLQKFPKGKWISYQNVEDYVNYRMLDIAPVTLYTARHRLYFSIKFENSYTEKHYVEEKSFRKEVVLPFLKGSFFLFAAFGLVEIAYNAPDTYQIGGTCYSPYDNLQFIKLTDLGAYVFGQTSEYERAAKPQQVPLVLSKDSLMILSDETDVTADILLQNYTQKVGANRYQTDAAIFLKNCQTKTDLKNKINLFKQTVTSDLPSNWQTFFATLLDNVNPLKKASSNYVVMQIPDDNKDLVRLIAQDVILKKYAIKAEFFHILVSKSNWAKFKNRLKELGFLMS